MRVRGQKLAHSGLVARSHVLQLVAVLIGDAGILLGKPSSIMGLGPGYQMRALSTASCCRYDSRTRREAYSTSRHPPGTLRRLVGDSGEADAPSEGNPNGIPGEHHRSVTRLAS
jgi:hypothetical protein